MPEGVVVQTVVVVVGTVVGGEYVLDDVPWFEPDVVVVVLGLVVVEVVVAAGLATLAA